MTYIHQEKSGFSVYEDSIDIKGLVKTKNIKISEIASVDANRLFRSLQIKTKDGKKHTVKLALKEYFDTTANFLQGKTDASGYKMSITKLNNQKEELVKQDKNRKIYWTLGIVGSIIFLGVLGSGEESTSTTNTTVAEVEETIPEVPDESQANIMAQGFVTQALRSPSTADFPFLDYTVNIQDNEYRVLSYVDSQNGFGAMVRTRWEVVMEYNGGEWALQRNWTLIGMFMDGEKVYPVE